MVEPSAFAHQLVPQRSDIVEQRTKLRAIVRPDRSGLRLQPLKPDQQAVILLFGYHRDTAEISVSNILSTVVITCEAAE